MVYVMFNLSLIIEAFHIFLQESEDCSEGAGRGDGSEGAGRGYGSEGAGRGYGSESDQDEEGSEEAEEGDGLAAGGSSCRFRKSHMVRPPIAPSPEGEKTVIRPCGDG
jgi:hypothetical protein